VKILLENESNVGWYIANPEVLRHVREHGSNPKYLSSVHFDTSRLRLHDNIDEAVSEADIIILAVPSAFLRGVLEPMTVALDDKFIISAIKGIIPGDYITVAEFVNRSYCVPFDRIGIITGPCHAEEVALERLSYLTLVSKHIENADLLCGKFASPYIRVSSSTDIYGTEYAAVLKNIYAIGVGICVSLGYGDNFLAVLVSNSAMEMNRFLSMSYAFDRNTCASAYLGDLLVTGYSPFSRNRTFGALIGKGYSIHSAMASMNMVAEGYYASECIMQVNKRFGIDMPIAESLHRILYEHASPSEEIARMSEKLF
jgi:glycerol-3-phosphate dehydrogenase (NAD(P)+)